MEKLRHVIVLSFDWVSFGKNNECMLLFVIGWLIVSFVRFPLFFFSSFFFSPPSSISQCLVA